MEKQKILVNPRGGSRWVIADIHGCYKTLQTLVEKRIKLTLNDQLFLLGDYINRGKNSAAVLDYLISLIRQEYQVFPLRGNHEQKLWNTWQNYNNVKLTSGNLSFTSLLTGAFELLDEHGKLPARYVHFLENLPYYYELDKFYLVHAGFDFTKEQPFTDFSSMILIRNFQCNLTDKTIVHGHQIKNLEEIVRRVRARSSIIPLDNGCYKKISIRKKLLNAFLGKRVGNLCSLNLDTFELFIQRNID